MNISKEINISHQDATQKFRPDLVGRSCILMTCQMQINYCAGNLDQSYNRINNQIDS